MSKNKMTEPYWSIYDDIHAVGKTLKSVAELMDEKLTSGEENEVRLTILEQADSLDTIADNVSGAEEDYNDLHEMADMVHDLEDKVIPEQDNYAGQTGEVLNRLGEYCTIQELEALEMLMRLKKGPPYGALDSMPHPDNVDMGQLNSSGVWIGLSMPSKFGGTPPRFPEGYVIYGTFRDTNAPAQTP